MTYRLTTIGGGTGSFNLLSGLRAHEECELRSIVTMMDSGGDSGTLRDAFGVLPPGDLRRCLVALSDESEVMRNLFSFRFEEAELAGRNFGNLFFLALTRSLGSERAAVDALGRILKIHGRVIPVTWDHSQLVAVLEGGEELHGEASIDGRPGLLPPHDPSLPIESLRLEPGAKANPDALDAIATSDVVILAPGDVFTSIVPNLLVEGIVDALHDAKLVHVLSLMSKHGETDGWSAARHVQEVARYCGRLPDAVLNHEGHFPAERLAEYEREMASPVEDDLAGLEEGGLRVHRAPLAAGSSLIHHDPARTADALMALVRSVLS